MEAVGEAYKQNVEPEGGRRPLTTRDGLSVRTHGEARTRRMIVANGVDFRNLGSYLSLLRERETAAGSYASA